MGVHVFQDDMSYESICLTGDYALVEIMSCGRSCVGGIHVFMMAYLAICSVLLEDITYWMTNFT